MLGAVDAPATHKLRWLTDLPAVRRVSVEDMFTSDNLLPLRTVSKQEI
jgi:hypothetical protein